MKRSPRDHPPDKEARSQGLVAIDAWKGAAVTRARLKCVKKVRNQGLGFPGDIRYMEGLKSKKKTKKCQDWNLKRVIKTSMNIKVEDARQHHEEAKAQKAEARSELRRKLGKNSIKLRRVVEKLSKLDKIISSKEDSR